MNSHLESASNVLIGSPIERIEDLRFLTGRGRFVGDLTAQNLLHAAILRSPLAHGRVRSVDTSAARALTGVAAVITATQVGLHVPLIPMRQHGVPAGEAYRQPVIASDKVRYVGEPLAVVVAGDPAIAEDALELIKLDIEMLPAVGDHIQARRRRRPLVRSCRHQSCHCVFRGASATPALRSLRPTTGAASTSACSVIPRRRWRRVACRRSGMSRPVA